MVYAVVDAGGGKGKFVVCKNWIIPSEDEIREVFYPPKNYEQLVQALVFQVEPDYATWCKYEITVLKTDIRKC